MSALLPTLLALAWLSHFPSGDRVVAQLAAAHAGRTPLHVEAALSAAAPEAPTRLSIDLHPELGMRIADDRGGRWVLQRGRVVAGTVLPAPGWLPDLEVLVLRREADLRAWLDATGIDASANELARCFESDCYVLGTRKSLAQLWVERPRNEIRRIVLPGRGPQDLEEWRAFDQTRFPARIEVTSDGSTSTLAVTGVSPSTALAPADFSAVWIEAARSASGR